ncbi:MAG: hypothetical protein WAS73_12355 [Defluviicoccus sp.]
MGQSMPEEGCGSHSTARRSICKNHWEDCVCFEVFVAPERVDGEDTLVDLMVNFAFNQQDVSLRFPRKVLRIFKKNVTVVFAIRCGRLQLNLRRLRAPLAYRNHRGTLPVESLIKVTTDKKLSEETEAIGEIGVTGGEFSILSKLRALLAGGESTTVEVEQNHSIITTSGGEARPKWTFSAEPCSAYLCGARTGERLVALVKDTDCVEAHPDVGLSGSFDIKQSDIHVIDISGYSRNCVNLKQEIMLRTLIQEYIFKKTGESLCSIEWTHGQVGH